MSSRMRDSSRPVSSRYSVRLAALAALNRLPRSSSTRASERSTRCTRSASSPAMIEPTCGRFSRLRSEPDPSRARRPDAGGRIVAGRDGHGAQHGRFARTARAVHEQRTVLVGVEVRGLLQLPGRYVHLAEQDLPVAEQRQITQVDGTLQVVEPGPAGSGDAGALRGLHEGGDQALLVVGSEVRANPTPAPGRPPTAASTRTAVLRLSLPPPAPHRSTSHRRTPIGRARGAPGPSWRCRVRAVTAGGTPPPGHPRRLSSRTRRPCAGRRAGWCWRAGCP